MARGMMNKAKKARRQGERKKRFPARRLVMSSTWLEWMPLHSGADPQVEISRQIQEQPVLDAGGAGQAEKPCAAAAEVCWKKVSSPSFTISG